MLRIIKHKSVCFYFCFLFLYLLLLAIHFNLAYAGDVLPDTGQTKCYNDTGEIPCPSPSEPFYGQDGNYQGPQPAYQVSADGLVVTDLNTGLMWQQSDDGITRNWNTAVTYCDGLTLGAYTDCLLPSRQELISLVDYGRLYPSINPAFGCRWPNLYYWSSSLSALNSDDAWTVGFGGGYASQISKSNLFYVRCVRRGQ